ncbi:hypothetical protein [Pantoea sp. 18069]|uniref:hypothetical protein n=1 Tax=Pantoea sp. 18069 TaxID=2681415 RepID=UPI001357B474|nr:hypothetical protein [Pantoea sp. 18069]
MPESYQNLLTTLAQEIGLEAAALIATEEIIIDDLPIGLQLQGEGERAEVVLCSLLAAPQMDRWDEVVRALMHANHLYDGTPGATLGMLPDDTVSLNVRRPLRALDAHKLAVLLAKTADLGLAWQDFIVSGHATPGVPAFFDTTGTHA